LVSFFTADATGNLSQTKAMVHEALHLRRVTHASAFIIIPQCMQIVQYLDERGVGDVTAGTTRATYRFRKRRPQSFGVAR